MVVGIKPNIPSFFDLHTDFRTAWVTPDISIGDASDPNWNGFPMPIHEGDVYIFDDDIPALALGGAYHMRASIRVETRIQTKLSRSASGTNYFTRSGSRQMIWLSSPLTGRQQERVSYGISGNCLVCR